MLRQFAMPTTPTIKLENIDLFASQAPSPFLDRGERTSPDFSTLPTRPQYAYSPSPPLLSDPFIGSRSWLRPEITANAAVVLHLSSAWPSFFFFYLFRSPFVPTVRESLVEFRTTPLTLYPPHPCP